MTCPDPIRHQFPRMYPGGAKQYCFNNMLEYGGHLLQDALETNWLTARHAPMVLWQDMQCGKVTWRLPDQVEKIQIQNTARVISARTNPPNTNFHVIMCVVAESMFLLTVLRKWDIIFITKRRTACKPRLTEGQS